MPLYAEAGIQEYWIINLQDKEIEVYQSPQGKEYQNRQVYKKGEIIGIDEFGVQMKVSDIIV